MTGITLLKVKALLGSIDFRTCASVMAFEHTSSDTSSSEIVRGDCAKIFADNVVRLKSKIHFTSLLKRASLDESLVQAQFAFKNKTYGEHGASRKSSLQRFVSS